MRQTSRSEMLLHRGVSRTKQKRQIHPPYIAPCNRQGRMSLE